MTRAEMRHIVWQQLGVRVPPGTTVEQMERLLHYQLLPSELPRHPINDMRDEIIRFIENNRDRLSLPCGGDCYQHTDAMVLNCHDMVRGEDAAKD